MTNLIYAGQRQATNKERKARGADVVFTYTDEEGRNIVLIYGATCHESWEQWGAPVELLIRNVPRVETWRQQQNF